MKFNVGDEVIVVRKYDKYIDPKWDNLWCPSMNKYVGKKIKVLPTDIHDRNLKNLGVYTETGYYFPECCLKLATDEITIEDITIF